MSRHGRSYVQPVIVTGGFQERIFTPSVSYPIGTIGHLTLTGKSISLFTGAVPTHVTFSIKRAWDNANWASVSGIGYAVYKFNMGTQAIGAKLAGGTAETTDGSGVIDVVTTSVGAFVADDVIVLFWKLGGGPAGENISGFSFEVLA